MQYSIRAAAIATGVSESCLRTWERRYGVPKPGRTESGRRRFEEADLATIRRMAALISAGMAASEAADAVLSEAANGSVDAQAESGDRQHPLSSLLATKAAQFEDGWVRRIIRDSVFSSGWEVTLERVVFPALRRLNSQWSAGAATMAHLRFAHELAGGEVQAELSSLGPVADPDRTVLVACAEDEPYDVVALGLSLVLRQRDFRVIYLGSAVSVADLIEAARQLKPDAICLLGTRRANPDALGRAARSVVGSRVPGVLFIGGSVLTRRDAPEIPGVHLPLSLQGAVERIAEALRRG